MQIDVKVGFQRANHLSPALALGLRAISIGGTVVVDVVWAVRYFVVIVSERVTFRHFEAHASFAEVPRLADRVDVVGGLSALEILALNSVKIQSLTVFFHTLKIRLKF